MPLLRDVHLGTLLFVGALAAAIYAGVLVVPHYVDRMNVVEAVETAALEAHSGSDAQLRALIQHRTSDMGTHLERDEDGELREVRGLGLTEENILIVRDPYTGAVSLEVHYQAPVRLFPTRKVHHLDMRVARTVAAP